MIVQTISVYHRIKLKVRKSRQTTDYPLEKIQKPQEVEKNKAWTGIMLLLGLNETCAGESVIKSIQM